MLFDAQEDIDIAPMWTNSTIETYSRIVSMFDFNCKKPFSNVCFFVPTFVGILTYNGYGEFVFC